MSVRAKFKCTKIDRTMGSRARRDAGGQQVKNEAGSLIYDQMEMRTVHLQPVYGGNDPNHENAKFWEATPSGKIELGTVNLAAAEQFELEKEYFIDFTPAA